MTLLDDLFNQLPPLVKQMKDAGLLPKETPTDPRERALYLVKNRHTGPTTRRHH